MKNRFLISILLNVITIPLAIIYIYRKIDFYNSQHEEVKSELTQNIFHSIRTTEFTELQVDSNSIVFLGDSHTQNFELAEALKNPNVKNRGIIFTGTKAVIAVINELCQYRPKKVFIQIGINDLLSGASVLDVTNDISFMIKTIKSNSPKTKIYVQSLFPTNWNIYNGKISVLGKVVQVNEQLKAICRYDDIIYVDVYHLLVRGKGLNPAYDSGDSLHLNGNGYMIWRDVLAALVNDTP